MIFWYHRWYLTRCRAPPQDSVIGGNSNGPTKTIRRSEDTKSDDDDDDDAAVASGIKDPNTGEVEPTPTEVEPGTQDRPVHNVNMGDVTNGVNNADKGSSSTDNAPINKAGSQDAEEDAGEDEENDERRRQGICSHIR